VKLKTLIIAITVTASFTIQAESATTTATPPDGKMTLYYEDGSKKIEKEYKYGQPFGTWTSWYDNGEIWGTIVFENTALPDYDRNSDIVKIELRYSDEDNTIRFRGEQFAQKLINTENNDGSPLVMPIWNYTYSTYNEKGELLKRNFVVELEDDMTGVVYNFPSLYWQSITDSDGNLINE